MAARTGYFAIITLPADSGRFLKTERRARSSISLKKKGRSVEVNISAKDVAALRASVMSVMRDIAVIDSVGSVIGRQGK